MSLLGCIAVGASWLLNLIGLPSQVIRNHRNRTAAALCPRMLVLLLLNSAIWLAYGWTIHNWYIVASNVPAVIFTALILLQWLRSRSPKPRTET